MSDTFERGPDFIAELTPHQRMTPEQCLGREARHAADYLDVIVVGYDLDGRLQVRSSELSRERAAFMALGLLRWAEGA